MARFAVIGLGRFGSKLARELTRLRAEVIAIDDNRDLVEELRDEVALAVRLDARDESALRAQGVGDVDVAIVGIGENFESAALAIANLKAIGVPRVIARAMTTRQGEIFSKIGADQIAYPENETAVRWAQRLISPALKDYIPLAEGHGLVQAKAPVLLHNKTPGELHLNRKYNVLVVAIRRAPNGQDADTSEATEVIVPRADTTFLPNDTIVLIGPDDALANLLKHE
jgi:trk system potassium uptake protein TrkA